MPHPTHRPTSPTPPQLAEGITEGAHVTSSTINLEEEEVEEEEENTFIDTTVEKFA